MYERLIVIDHHVYAQILYANRYIHVREQLWNSNPSAEVSRYLSKFNTWTSVENANEPAMTKSLPAGFLDFLSPATRFCVSRTHLQNGGVFCAVPAVELPKGSKKARMDPTLQSCSLAVFVPMLIKVFMCHAKSSITVAVQTIGNSALLIGFDW